MNLTKGNAETLPTSDLYVGAGWDLSSGGKKGLLGKVKKAKGVDLDVLGVVFDDGKNAIRVCDYDAPDPFHNGSITHSGDNTTGKGDGDDEFITVSFARLPNVAAHVVFALSAYKQGVSFANVRGVTCRLVDQSNGEKELGVFYPPVDARQTAVVMGVASKVGEDWQFRVVNELGAGQGETQLISLAKRYLP